MRSTANLKNCRPPPVGVPTDGRHLEECSSPWNEKHGALFQGMDPPRGISLKAFEICYRKRLAEIGASSAWSPSSSKGFAPMIDLWIRISTQSVPRIPVTPDCQFPRLPPDIEV